MATAPSISLIITVYNRDQYLRVTIESVLAQTRRDFELVIWDDGSTDESLEIARHYEQRDDRIRVVAAAHQGLSPTLKAAISASTAPFLGWVDSDDLLAPGALEETAAILEAQPDTGMVYTNYQVIDAGGNDHGVGYLCQVPYSPQRLLIDFMTFHFRLIRRSVYEQVGGIDRNYPISEDYDLCLKLSEVTTIQHLARPLYFYRRHSGNTTNNQIQTIQWTQRAIESALKRRHLETRYQLHTRMVSYFSLQPRSAIKQDKQPTILMRLESQPPLVSVVIPCYSAALRLEACLQSCRAQRYSNLEILVIDNHSIDASMSIANQWAERGDRPMRVLNCLESGANATRNLGLQHAQGEYIQWLDADDTIHPDKIALQVADLEQHASMDIAFGDWEWQFAIGHQTTQFNFIGQSYPDMVLQLLWDNWRPPHCYLLRRSAAERLHRLRAWYPTTTVCMDREYFTLAALLGLQFHYVPQSSVRYYWWSTSQLSLNRSYRDRVSSRARMFQRFCDVAAVQWTTEMNGDHQFLLQQNWSLWMPAFTIQSGEGQAHLKHRGTNRTLRVSLPQQHIAEALLNLPSAQTLEDMARFVLRQLWSELIVEVSQACFSQQLLNMDRLSLKLAQRLGLASSSTSAPSLSVQYGSETHSTLTVTPLFHDLPLFAPLFGEYRLVVQGFLETLRQQGWLYVD